VGKGKVWRVIKLVFQVVMKFVTHFRERGRGSEGKHAAGVEKEITKQKKKKEGGRVNLQLEWRKKLPSKK
jgi:hypothetical protein